MSTSPTTVIPPQPAAPSLASSPAIVSEAAILSQTVDDLIRAVQESLQSQRRPRATYRVQFNREFTFRQATELVPYWSALGVSDVYASPRSDRLLSRLSHVYGGWRRSGARPAVRRAGRRPGKAPQSRNQQRRLRFRPRRAVVPGARNTFRRKTRATAEFRGPVYATIQ